MPRLSLGPDRHGVLATTSGCDGVASKPRKTESSRLFSLPAAVGRCFSTFFRRDVSLDPIPSLWDLRSTSLRSTPSPRVSDFPLYAIPETWSTS